MELPERIGFCSVCNRNVRATLSRRITESHTATFAWCCPGCKVVNPFRDPQYWIPHSEVFKLMSEEDAEKLPTTMPQLLGRCAVCGARGVEKHHWAPQAIFGTDIANQWPMDFLCKACHDHWHNMVTKGKK